MKTLGLIFLIIGLLLIITGIQILINSKEKTYCGVIKYKVDATKYSKHSSYSDPIFVMNFPAQNDERAFIKEVRPNWDTYLSYKQGDTVCFTLKHPDRPEPGDGAMLLILAVLILLVGSLFYWD